MCAPPLPLFPDSGDPILLGSLVREIRSVAFLIRNAYRLPIASLVRSGGNNYNDVMDGCRVFGALRFSVEKQGNPDTTKDTAASITTTPSRT